MNRFALLRLTVIATALLLSLGQSAYAQEKIVVPPPPIITYNPSVFGPGGTHQANQDLNDPEKAFDAATGQNLVWDRNKKTWVDVKTGAPPTTWNGATESPVNFEGRLASDGTIVPPPPVITYNPSVFGPGGTHQAKQDLNDPEKGFDAATGQNLVWDRNQKTWVDAKTGAPPTTWNGATESSVNFEGRLVNENPTAPTTPPPTKVARGPGPTVSPSGNPPLVAFAPPELPVYEQPLCPTPGYMWTPGYWGYVPIGYFWVPGTWVPAPAPGLLWTPGYWGFASGLYGWHEGYWGPHVGFYGGVNYGFGYGGVGFGGGVWEGGVFRYNTAVVRVDTTVIHNTYVDSTVIHETTVNRASFNGEGGTTARPTAAEEAAAREPHTAPTSEQLNQEHLASTNPSCLALQNHGQPSVAATAKAGEFSGQGVVAAHGSGGGSGKTEAASSTPAKSETHTEAATPTSKESTKTPKNKKAAKPPKPTKAQSESKPQEKEHPK